MRKQDDNPKSNWDKLRRRVLGLGERSVRKSYYPALQEQLNELERFRALLDQAHDGILLISRPSGSIADANARAAEIFDCRREELVNRTIDSLFDDEVLSSLGDIFSNTSSLPTTPVTLSTRLNKDRIVEITVTIREHQDSSFGVATVRDVTEKHQLEQQLRQSQKLQAIGQLAGGVAHDFNNLLSGILGYAELIQLETIGNVGVQSMTRSIVKAATRAASLTSKLLAYARCGVTRTVVVNVNDVVNEVFGLLSHTVDKRIELISQVESQAVHVLGDPTLLQNAILNLAINARDAMPQGGKLCIAVSKEHCTKATLLRRGLDCAPGDFISISVTDTGHGIEADNLQRIFEPFFTTKEVGQGTGLGLAAVYGTAVELGGGVTVSSQVGEGSTFTLCLPEARTKTSATVKTASDIATGSEKILIIDDERAVRDVTSRMLAGLGYATSQVTNGQEAIERIKDNESKFDLILLDVIMPGPACVEVLNGIKSLSPKTIVMIMTGHDFGTSREELVQAGAASFLRKPFERQELATKVRELLDSASN